MHKATPHTTVGMEFVAALMAALHQIEDDPNHKGRISLPNSLVLTCEPPQYVIGDGMAACFVFPVLDDLKEFINAMESAIALNRKSADRPKHNRPATSGASVRTPLS
jgi:hypothetical protein